MSHTGLSRECHAVGRLAELEGAVGAERYRRAEVIGVDEAQFLPDLLEFCRFATDVHRKHVIVAGLDGDFRRQVRARALSLSLSLSRFPFAPSPPYRSPLSRRVGT